MNEDMMQYNIDTSNMAITGKTRIEHTYKLRYTRKRVSMSQILQIIRIHLMQIS